MSEKPERPIFDIQQIKEFIPHRYPFLMLDKILSYEENKSIVAVKNVTVNEPFFEGHFPEDPVMPGVMILEAMAQAGGVLATLGDTGIDAGQVFYLVGYDSVKWKHPVRPGDSLRIEVELIKKRRPFWVMGGKVLVDGTVVAQGKFTAAEAGAS